MNIGIDIIENDRLNDSVAEKFLSPDEFLYYRNLSGRKKINFFCGRWAAKEAIIKALSPYETDINRQHLIIMNNDVGAPYVNYKNYKLRISISHEKSYSVAICIVTE